MRYLCIWRGMLFGRKTVSICISCCWLIPIVIVVVAYVMADIAPVKIFPSGLHQMIVYGWAIHYRENVRFMKSPLGYMGCDGQDV